MDRATYEALELEKFGPKLEVDFKNWGNYVVARELRRMRVILELGLHPVYDNFEAFLDDYFPDFSWKTHAFIQDLRSIYQNPEWIKLAVAIREKWGFDFISEVNAAIVEAEEDGEYW